MVISVVGGLDQEWNNAVLHLLDNIDERVSEGTTCIYTTFTLEVDPVNSAINILVSEIIQVRVALFFYGLDDLSIDAVLAFVINLSFISEKHSFVPIHIYLGLTTVRNGLQLSVNDLVDDSGKRHMSVREVLV